MPETEQAALQEEPAEPRNHAKTSKAVQEGNKKVRAIRSALIKLTDENSNDNGWISSSYLGNLVIRQIT